MAAAGGKGVAPLALAPKPKGTPTRNEHSGTDREGESEVDEEGQTNFEVKRDRASERALYVLDRIPVDAEENGTAP